jgi:hypothetical protein
VGTEAIFSPGNRTILLKASACIIPADIPLPKIIQKMKEKENYKPLHQE